MIGLVLSPLEDILLPHLAYTLMPGKQPLGLLFRQRPAHHPHTPKDSPSHARGGYPRPEEDEEEEEESQPIESSKPLSFRTRPSRSSSVSPMHRRLSLSLCSTGPFNSLGDLYDRVECLLIDPRGLGLQVIQDALGVGPIATTDLIDDQRRRWGALLMMVCAGPLPAPPEPPTPPPPPPSAPVGCWSSTLHPSPSYLLAMALDCF